MKNSILLLTMVLLPLKLNAAGGEGWNDTIESDQGQFAVSVSPAKKQIEVKKVEGAGKAPPHLRVRVLRENDRPFELRLKTTERTPDSPIHYTGQFKQWNDSYMGFEIDFSFDKKTWKRLGRTLKKVAP